MGVSGVIALRLTHPITPAFPNQEKSAGITLLPLKIVWCILKSNTQKQAKSAALRNRAKLVNQPNFLD